MDEDIQAQVDDIVDLFILDYSYAVLSRGCNISLLTTSKVLLVDLCKK